VATAIYVSEHDLVRQERRGEWQPHGISGKALRRLAAEDLGAAD
jgi:hypothetical protein